VREAGHTLGFNQLACPGFVANLIKAGPAGRDVLELATVAGNFFPDAPALAAVAVPPKQNSNRNHHGPQKYLPQRSHMPALIVKRVASDSLAHRSSRIRRSFLAPRAAEDNHGTLGPPQPAAPAERLLLGGKRGYCAPKVISWAFQVSPSTQAGQFCSCHRAEVFGCAGWL